MAKYKYKEDEEYNYNYKKGTDDFSDNFRENQLRWQTEPEEAHSAQTKNVSAFDEITGGKSNYTPETGSWRLSDGRRSTAGGIEGNSFLSPYFDRTQTEGYKIRENARKKYRDSTFLYNPDNDELYQQYKRQYIENGQRATDDAIARSAARTGGLASSYATTAGALAYQDYMQGLNDKIPELAQLAYQKWQDEQARSLEEASYGDDMIADEYSDWAAGRSEYLSQKEKSDNEKLSYALAMNKAQTDGFSALSDAEMEALYSAGAYYDPKKDVIVDSSGISYELGLRNDSEKLSYALAMNKAQTDGFSALSNAEREALYSAGAYYDPKKDVIVDSSGMSYELGLRNYSAYSLGNEDSKIASTLLKAQNSKSGTSALSTSEIATLMDAGYTVEDNEIISPQTKKSTRRRLDNIDVMTEMRNIWLYSGLESEADKQRAVDEYLSSVGMSEADKKKYIEGFISTYGREGA